VTVVEIADAGHSPYFERPDEYNAALLGFLGGAS
jgi:pimeloyl-ACP methyl ester carboxylesterase